MLGIQDYLGFGVFAAAGLFVWRFHKDMTAVERARMRRAAQLRAIRARGARKI